MKIFDADSEQFVELNLRATGRDGRQRIYEVRHCFRAMTDEEYFQYEEKKRIRQKISGTDTLEVQTEDESLKAAEWLWNLLAIRREGYAEREDWKEATNLLDKQAAIEKGLLAVFVAEDSWGGEQTEEDADMVLDDALRDDCPQAIRLECLFNSEPVTTVHYFRQPTARDVADYEKIIRRVQNLIDGRRGFRKRPSAEMAIPSKARELAALYNRLIDSTEGYAGRVPAHHKREAVIELFSREAMVAEKN